jgi:hypothetical protein
MASTPENVGVTILSARLLSSAKVLAKLGYRFDIKR